MDVFFGIFSNLRHCFNRQNGVFTRSSFTRKHYCACTVVNGVCNVGNFGTGGAWIFYHRFKHFSSGNYTLTKKTALCDKMLLNLRNLMKQNLNSRHLNLKMYSNRK